MPWWRTRPQDVNYFFMLLILLYVAFAICFNMQFGGDFEDRTATLVLLFATTVGDFSQDFIVNRVLKEPDGGGEWWVRGWRGGVGRAGAACKRFV